MTSHSYTIATHNHRFAAWAASRAASVKNCRFKVEIGLRLLEGCGLTSALSDPSQLPVPDDMNLKHRQWRTGICQQARQTHPGFSHGVAAKLINCYLKSRFVCGGHQNHKNVAALHPPIDKLLLDGLGAVETDGNAIVWRRYSRKGWSKLDSDGYEKLIEMIQEKSGDDPLWMIERFWPGHQ